MINWYIYRISAYRAATGSSGGRAGVNALKGDGLVKIRGLIATGMSVQIKVVQRCMLIIIMSCWLMHFRPRPPHTTHRTRHLLEFYSTLCLFLPSSRCCVKMEWAYLISPSHLTLPTQRTRVDDVWAVCVCVHVCDTNLWAFCYQANWLNFVKNRTISSTTCI